ncbi:MULTISPECIES: hypothetical protein [Virgibacillus]|uniref:Uncharacterized protein n=2 Tax=Virgibacillus TaxID=84406 RepID=A0A024QJ75_9BACI|nr:MULTISPECIES: hypothetical protein [Virgibacillus]EQB36939.1 hypothetical protein M948_10960 [Virgibacillus sp. CM-4]MYL43115.1 transposase [Virgibacillus massiliensis]GGJ64940.1 hypothetical protein GCM10007111_28520 [Virgibacillus kapii]CDQ41971.1 hypothetical protein BN990_04350 [Virgibacillus massiliensis]
MKLLLILGSIFIPAWMYYIQRRYRKTHIMFTFAALFAALVFGNIVATSIYQVIKNNTVLMTDIHAILLNPFFQISGLYLGAYFLYLLFIGLLKNLHHYNHPD